MFLDKWLNSESEGVTRLATLLWLIIVLWFGGLKYDTMIIVGKLWLIWVGAKKYGQIWLKYDLL